MTAADEMQSELDCWQHIEMSMFEHLVKGYLIASLAYIIANYQW